jgi:hypothetical protein
VCGKYADHLDRLKEVVSFCFAITATEVSVQHLKANFAGPRISNNISLISHSLSENFIQELISDLR